jgi:hypothetical protein
MAALAHAVKAPGAVPDRAGAVAVEDRSELVRGPAGLRRRPGVGPVPVPGAVVPGRGEKRGEGGASQFRVAARDHQCGHVIVVPGDLPRDGPAGWQSCRHDRGPGDDLGRGLCDRDFFCRERRRIATVPGGRPAGGLYDYRIWSGKARRLTFFIVF